MSRQTLSETIITSPDAQCIAMRAELDKEHIVSMCRSSNNTFRTKAGEFRLVPYEQSSLKAIKEGRTIAREVLEVVKN